MSMFVCVLPLQGLMRISDYQRRRILNLIKHFKATRKQQKPRSAFTGSRSWNGGAVQARLNASGRGADMLRAASMPASGVLAGGSPETSVHVGIRSRPYQNGS